MIFYLWCVFFDFIATIYFMFKAIVTGNLFYLFYSLFCMWLWSVMMNRIIREL